MLICKFAPEKSIKFDLMYAKVSRSDILLYNPAFQRGELRLTEAWRSHVLYLQEHGSAMPAYLPFPGYKTPGYIKGCGSATKMLLMSQSTIIKFGCPKRAVLFYISIYKTQK